MLFMGLVKALAECRLCGAAFVTAQSPLVCAAAVSSHITRRPLWHSTLVPLSDTALPATASPANNSSCAHWLNTTATTSHQPRSSHETPAPGQATTVKWLCRCDSTLLECVPAARWDAAPAPVIDAMAPAPLLPRRGGHYLMRRHALTHAESADYTFQGRCGDIIPAGQLAGAPGATAIDHTTARCQRAVWHPCR